MSAYDQCPPPFPLAIYSERREGPSLKDLPENRTSVSKTLYCCLFSDQTSYKISVSCGHKGLYLCILKLLYPNNQTTHYTLRRLENFWMSTKKSHQFSGAEGQTTFQQKKCCFASFYQQVSFHRTGCYYTDSTELCICTLQDIQIKY